MSRLDELIAELCPDGVESVLLSSVLKSVRTGLNPRKNFVLNTKRANNYYVTVKEITSGKIIFSDKTDKIDSNAVSVIQQRSNLEYNDVLLSGIGTIGKVALVDIPTDNWNCSESVFLLKPRTDKILPRFLMFLLGSNSVTSQWNKQSVGSTLRGIRMETVNNLRIPLPPLPVQREIVRILDHFTEFTAELTAQLAAEVTARKKQYEYYRDALLTFGEDVPVMTLGDVAEFKYGYTDTAKDSGAVRFIRITDIGDNGKLQPTNRKYIDLTPDSEGYLLKKGDLLMARTGATYGKTMLFEKEANAVYASFLIRIRFPTGVVLPAYYWHFAQSGLYWNQANRLVSKAGQPQFNANALKRVQIPIPSLEEQRRIIELLNRFDLLTNDLTSGLPAEIAARQKQYEYYRDQLLTFDGVTT
ncbi:MAG: restriction endonuclease subunit S [Candidatus Promineofilum sp.]|nr:restriction endonuclease subunit S [Promineifilum sp.]